MTIMREKPGIRKLILVAAVVITAASLGALAVFGELAGASFVKLNPVALVKDVSGAWVDDAAAWALFDRDRATTYAPASATNLLVMLPAETDLAGIKVYGSASYTLTVYEDTLGSWRKVPGLDAIALRSQPDSWNTFKPAASLHTGRLLIEITPSGGSAGGIQEMEIWGGEAGDPGLSLKAVRTAADARAVLAASPRPVHVMELAALPQTIDVPADGNSYAVHFTLGPDPRLVKRAFLVYDSYNADYPVSPEKRINGLAWTGGFVPASSGMPQWTSQVEEINPAWLVRGDNRVEFRNLVTTRDPSSYFVRDLKVIAELENGWNSLIDASGAADNANHAAPRVIDGDLTTYFEVKSDHILDLTADRVVQPDMVRVHLWSAADTMAGTVTIQYRQGNQWKNFASGGTLDLAGLKNGWNDIKVPAAVSTDSLRFTIHATPDRKRQGATVGGINELELIASPVGAPAPRGLVVTAPASGEFFGRTAYLQGFIGPATNPSGAVQVSVEGKTLSNADGSFSLALTKDETRYANQNDNDAWEAVVTATYPDGSSLTQTVPFTKNLLNNSPSNTGDSNQAAASQREKFSDKVVPGQAKKIQYKGVTIEIPADAVDRETEITIIPLTELDLSRLNPGMINVTYPDAGYRFLPHGMKFKKPVKISFGYSKTLFAAGQVDDEVNMYYYDNTLLRWQKLNRVKADAALSQVTSESDHFTDIINSTLVVPEHPQALTFNPNSIKDIKAADPSANINLIEPPKANNKGTANLNYPIEVPPGRNKLQPNIAVQYNSAGGNGWMGLGWDIPMQSISIDTRWGAPRYDTGEIDGTPRETETYMLDGEQLAPAAYRGDPAPRTAEKIFHTRIESRFRRIIRHGAIPANYWWEVIDKNGTRYFYGGDPANGVLPGATLNVPHADAAKRHIFKWALSKVKDANNNTIDYIYSNVEDSGVGDGTGGIPGHQLYPDSIYYTGTGTTRGAYRVAFKRDRDLPQYTRRPDVGIDGRGGFKMVTADRLRKIEVWFKDQPVRSYDFNYQTGAFGKTMLTSIVQNGSNGTPFNTHEIDYYDDLGAENGAYAGFRPGGEWSAGDDGLGKEYLGINIPITALGGNFGRNKSWDIYRGLGLGPTKMVSRGRKNGRSSSDSEGLVAIIDLNGDNLPDKVFDCKYASHNNCSNSRYAYRPNLGGGRFDERVVPLPSMPALAKESIRTTSRGTELYVVANYITNTSISTMTQTAYFADVNGDGLPDMVKDGVVYFNYLVNGVPTFVPSSFFTPSPIDQGQNVDTDGTLPDFSDLKKQMVRENPLMDAVRRWVAPYDGTVGIAGSVSLIQDSSDERKEYSPDGFRAAIQLNGAEQAAVVVGPDDYNAHPMDLPSLAVKKGDRIYFRVQSRIDGAYDQVAWEPVITYSGVPAELKDANNLASYIYGAKDDYNFAGRPVFAKLPYKGTVRITGDLVKKGVTTDDINLAVYVLTDAELETISDINKVYLTKAPVISKSLGWNETGSLTFLPGADGNLNDDIPVGENSHMLILVRADSNIDLSRLDWKPQAFYVEAFAPSQAPQDENGDPAQDEEKNPVGHTPGAPLPVLDSAGKYQIQLKPIYDIEFYPENRLNAPQNTWTATEAGTVLVTPNLAPKTALGEPGFVFDDDVVFTVKRSGVRLGKQTITLAKGMTTVNPVLHSFEVAVNQGDRLFFDFTSRDHDPWRNIDATGVTAHYIKPAAKVTLSDIPLSLSGTVNPKHTAWGATASGTATITPALSPQAGGVFDFDGQITLNVVHVYNVDGPEGQTTVSAGFARTIAVRRWQAIDPAAYAFDITIGAGDTLKFFYTTPDAGLLTAQMARGAVVRITTNAATLDIPTTLHSPSMANAFSRPYRGWGYIGYNGNDTCLQKLVLDGASGPCEEPPIDESRLVFSTNRRDYEGGDPNNTPRESAFFVAAPDAYQERWISEDDQWWITAGGMNSSRRGLKKIVVPDAGDFKATPAVPRITQSTQDSTGGGLFISFSRAVSPADTLLEFMDMNGDRYPDIVSKSKIQYTLGTGKLEPHNRDTGPGVLRATRSVSRVIGPGGTVPSSPKNAKNSNDTANQKPPADQHDQTSPFGFTGSLGNGDNEGQIDLVDINGDGLPDLVSQSGDGIQVRFNLGYGFTDTFEPWGTGDLSKGKTKASLSVNLGYSDGVRGWSGGVSLGANFTETKATMRDMNGDGLPDRVYNSGPALMAAFNTGAGFTDPVAWSGSKRLGDGKSITFGAGGSVSLPIGPLCWPTPFCFIILNPAVNWSDNLSRSEEAFIDIDGDGYADYLKSDSDRSIAVELNNTGRTGLLKSVKRPLGGAIELEYERRGNVYEMPQSQWVMTRAKLSDGAGNAYETSVAYSEPHQDRYEREFFGFRQVTETKAPGTPLARTETGTYNNSDYFLKGTLEKSATTDGDGYIWARTVNTYDLVAVMEGNAEAPGVKFPELTKTDTYFYTGKTRNEYQYAKLTSQEYAYDGYGNVTRFIDRADDGDADDVYAAITYWTDPSPGSYIVGKPKNIRVTDGSRSAVYRERTADYEQGTGNLRQLTMTVPESINPVWEMTYYPNGNLETIKYPKGDPKFNTHQDSFVITYTYDEETGIYVGSIADSYGYTSEAGYNHKFGRPEWQKDLNGNYQVNTYDDFGRLAKIYGPCEAAGPTAPEGATPTLAFSYTFPPNAGAPFAPPAGAITRNKAAACSENRSFPAQILTTATYGDGMKRIIQTKKQAQVGENVGMTVSGANVYDALGRVTEQDQPAYVTPLNETYSSGLDRRNTTYYSYDGLDRTVRVIAPDGATTATVYGFEGLMGAGNNLFLTTVIDPMGNIKKSYKDVHDRIHAVVEYNRIDGKPVEIVTAYDYDLLGQIVRVKDAKGNITGIAYDRLGRRTGISNPDTGLTTYTYDANSNVTTKETENLRKGAKKITYTYDYNRLQEINYPDSPHVVYAYGAKDDTKDNQAGRIRKVTDESGEEERYYGKLGEVTKERRRVNAFNNPVARTWFETRYVFDSFGRMQQLTYPDGEILTYEYDAGGLLRRAEGVKRGNRYVYISKLQYDEYGQRAFAEYGNGVTTGYTYDEKTRRLTNLKTVEKKRGRTLQNIGYKYDLVGNILSTDNTKGVPYPPGGEQGGPVWQDFTYDDLYQLIAANGTFQPSADKKTTYANNFAYDMIGNITNKVQQHHVMGANSSVEPRETNYILEYKYTGSRPHAVTDAGDRLYTYDDNGNMRGWTSKSSGQQRTITWNEENRVKSIADQGSTIVFLYDDGGERAVKRGQHGESVYVSRFYSLKNGGLGSKHVFAGETRVVTKLEKDGGSTQTGVPGTIALLNSHGIYTAYTQGNGRHIGIDRRLNPAGGTGATNPPLEKFEFFYHGDHLGSSSFITDDAGAVYQHLEYFPYGETWVEEGGSGQMPMYRFTGKELDPETGLYYYGARYYDPVLSRWISADPALEKYFKGIAGGVHLPSNLQLYSYSWNNPVVFKDPDGNSPAAALLEYQAAVAAASGGAVGGGFAGSHVNRTRLGGYTGTQLDWGPPPFLIGAWNGFKTLVTHPGQALQNLKNNLGLGTTLSTGAKDAPVTTNPAETKEWIYGPKDDPQINPDGSTRPNTWTTPDNFPTAGEATDKLDPFKPVEGRRPVNIPEGVGVKRGTTPGGEGPNRGSGGANETLVPGGLPPGSAGPWEPLP